jgi:GNAT superfamily N-acetyltransferase
MLIASIRDWTGDSRLDDSRQTWPSIWFHPAGNEGLMATGGRMASESLELRRAVAADAAAIRELTREAYAKWVPVIGREPKPMAADYAEALRKNRFDLLFAEGKLTALIETIAQEDCLLIENVAVSPLWQGRGIGRKLMAHAERLAASLGYGEIRLYTNRLFAENLRLYLELGYRVDSEEPFKGGWRVNMSKPVGPQSG